MAVTARVDAADFSRDFDRLDAAVARSGVVEVTRGEQVVGGYLSAAEFKAYQRLRADATPQVLKSGNFNDDTLAMLDAADYGRIDG